MKARLLQHTLRGYSAYAIGLLLVSIPLFYGVMLKLHLDDIDEALLLRADEFKTNVLPTFRRSEITDWNRFNRDTKIARTPLFQNDSLFYQSYYDTLANELEPYRVFVTRMQIEEQPFMLWVRLNLIETADLLSHIVWLYIALMALLLGGLYGLTRYYSQKLWRPFYNTLSFLEQYELEKNSTLNLPESWITEFDRLNQSLTRLLGRNYSAYERQREFLDNAAHELQTPLAILSARLDTFLQAPGLSSGQARRLAPLYKLVARINRINKNLLLLSKIDHNAYQQKEQADIAALLRQACDFFEDQAGEKKVALHVGRVESLTVHANTDLADILINNLLLNAIRHNYRYGHIDIELINSRLMIRNTGTRAPLHRERLFERFADLGSPSKGNGLGLAIVKEIADLHQWRIEYDFVKEYHCFSVIF